MATQLTFFFPNDCHRLNISSECEIRHNYVSTLNLLKRKCIIYFFFGNYVTLHTHKKNNNHKMLH